MATLYYNDAMGDLNWGTLGNWWTDADFNIQATALPTATDNVVLSAPASSNSSGAVITVANLELNDPTENAVYLELNITVTGTAVFNSIVSNNGTITGNAIFNDAAYNAGVISGNATFNDFGGNYGEVGGDATFNDSTANPGLVVGAATFNDGTNNPGVVYGNATFNGISHNGGTVEGDAAFNDSSYNNGSIYGFATFRDSSYATFDGVMTAGVFTNRAPYPIPRGINGSSILGVI